MYYKLMLNNKLRYMFLQKAIFYKSLQLIQLKAYRQKILKMLK